MSENLSFENMIERLEKIADFLDSGDATLDQSLKSYEEAVKLFVSCEKQISSAEARVRMIVEGHDGSITDMPFDSDDET